VRELQAVTALPLQLDTSDPIAMERAMRIYNGKPMINSVNGKAESMDAIFPLVQKYGGLVVCLTLDEGGIPDTAEQRLEIAKRITARAADYGIAPCDLIFDPLAMAISSDSSAGLATLDAISLIRSELGAQCSLGISNVSFGLPNRDYITAGFFTLALSRGLGAAIMNPFSLEMQKAYHSYMALTNQDASCQKYIAFAQNIVDGTVSSAPSAKAENEPTDALQSAIVHGLREESGKAACKALETADGLTVINEQIIPALDIVGQGFEKKTVFLPQLLMSAEAAKAAFDEVRKTMPAGDGAGDAIILATVKGDIHDIGKNIVKVLLENYGYRVIDLGRDVAPEVIAETAIEQDVRLVGLSALMTTTVPAMEDTIKLLREKKPDALVVVGGAVLTQEYSDMIGADRYSKTAMDTVRYAEEIFGK
jgi:5-methyltetrahydrofolate--homocysteine methyltransferase